MIDEGGVVEETGVVHGGLDGVAEFPQLDAVRVDRVLDQVVALRAV